MHEIFAERFAPEKPLKGPHITHFNEEGGEEEKHNGEGPQNFADEGCLEGQGGEEEAGEEEKGRNQPVNEEGEEAPKNSGKLKGKLNIFRGAKPVMFGKASRFPGGEGGGRLHGEGLTEESP
jgi:hypothetical protein